ncbi:MAG: hypothetical protein JKY89_05785 [Immundisolibacteraceae bacterium]|nr:hypothetical protein [Immundisolibacteraceae bacterium]
MKPSKFPVMQGLFSAVLLAGTATLVQAEANLPPVPDPETVFITESPSPGMVDRAREGLNDGLQRLQSSGSAGFKSSREMGGRLVERGQHAAGRAWSSTKQTSADWADKSTDAASRAGDSVARFTDRSIQAGAEVWESTKAYSTEIWQKGQQVGETVKSEIVGIDGPPAEVINKSAPLEP